MASTEGLQPAMGQLKDCSGRANLGHYCLSAVPQRLFLSYFAHQRPLELQERGLWATVPCSLNMTHLMHSCSCCRLWSLQLDLFSITSLDLSHLREKFKTGPKSTNMCCSIQNKCSSLQLPAQWTHPRCMHGNMHMLQENGQLNFTQSSPINLS